MVCGAQVTPSKHGNKSTSMWILWEMQASGYPKSIGVRLSPVKVSLPNVVTRLCWHTFAITGRVGEHLTALRITRAESALNPCPYQSVGCGTSTLSKLVMRNSPKAQHLVFTYCICLSPTSSNRRHCKQLKSASQPSHLCTLCVCAIFL